MTSSCNLELCFKVIPDFKGKTEELQPFLKIIEIINNSIKPEDRILLIDFVKNIKCNSVVRTVIGTTRCETIEDLKTILTERYKIKKTIPQIQNKLSKFIQ